MAMIISADGSQHQVEVGLDDLKAASDAGISLSAHLGAKYKVDATKHGRALDQALASIGVSVNGIKDSGVAKTTVKEMMEGTGPGMNAAITVKEGVPQSRILLPPAILQYMEDKLVGNLTMTADAFEGMIAEDVSVNNDRYDQPVVNYDKVGETARSQVMTQLAAPAAMMTITVSDRSRRVPTYSLGLEISQQAMAVSTIDFVGLSLARQHAIERNARANDYIMALLNGDVDNGESDLATLGYSVNASALDSASTGGTITQKAWMKFLYRNSLKRKIDWVVTDMDTALKIESRTGKPVIVSDNPNSNRIDTVFDTANPTWADRVKLFIVSPDYANWPANTVMGLDSRYAIRRVTNSSASYQAMENLIMRRSTQLRIDFGETITRLFPEAFDTLVLA